ncbi:MAG: hypothetical protein HKN16_03810 [Saprospiraceae bacterium]|nr:hypothetical protein [Saprospiraceae bacterium]
MKAYKSLILFVALMLAIPFSSTAQSYTTAVGVRLGTGIGLSVQQVVFPQWTLEGVLQKRAGEYSTHYALLAEHHRKLIGKRLNFYLGAGIQGGILEGRFEEPVENPIGIAGVGGLEFTLKRFNISVDFMPELNVRGGAQTFRSTTGVSVRYVLIKAPKKNKEKVKRKKQKAKEKKQKQKLKGEDKSKDQGSNLIFWKS